MMTIKFQPGIGFPVGIFSSLFLKQQITIKDHTFWIQISTWKDLAHSTASCSGGYQGTKYNVAKNQRA